jgi:hypothetical protein
MWMLVVYHFETCSIIWLQVFIMDINTIGICVTVIVGIIAIALSVYLGLRGFSNSISKKVDETKDGVVLELSGIKENIIKIGTRVDDVWQLVSQLALLLTKGQTVGTIEVELKNFGKTKISAQLAEKETIYIVQSEKGKLFSDAIGRISKYTTLEKTELEIFGRETLVDNIGNWLRVRIPNVEPKLCTQYMSLFLKWLDTEYVTALQSETDRFEKDIKV